MRLFPSSLIATGWLIPFLLVGCDLLVAPRPTATPAPTVSPIPASTTPSTTPITSTATPSSSYTPLAPIMLSVYVVDYSPGVTDVWFEQEVVPAFRQLHPEIDVQFIWGSWSDFDEVTQGFFASGRGPDIVNINYWDSATYGDEFAVLDPYLGPEAWPEINQFLPAAVDTVKWKDQLRGLPVYISPQLVYCREDRMQAAGYTEQPANFAQWLQFAHDASIPDEYQHAFAAAYDHAMSDADWYLMTLQSLGGSIYKEDGVTPNFDSAEARAALQFSYNMKQTQWEIEEPWWQGYPWLGEDGPRTNRVACQWGPTYMLPPADDPAWQILNIEPFKGDPPSFPNSRPIIPLTGGGWWGVPAYSPKPQAAAEFLKFVFSRENNYRFNETFQTLPARVDAYYGYVTESTVLRRQTELIPTTAISYAGILELSELRYMLQSELGWYVHDQQDQQTTLRHIQQQYTQMLQDAGHLP